MVKDEEEEALENYPENLRYSERGEAMQEAFDNLKEAILETVSELKEREKNVVVLRFGLNDMGKKTLDEIGKLYGITKECVRQTEIRALKRLRTICLKAEMV